jgi:hypothetical protein
VAAGVGLDRAAAVEQLDRLAVGAGVHMGSDPVFGDGVQRFGDLDVVVAVDLDRAQERLVVAGPDGQQQPGLPFGEHCGGAGGGGVPASPVEPWNAGSIRVAEAAGFQPEGLLRSHQEIGGTRRDMLLYAMIRG